ncbi:phosphatidylinositol-specific phospholipase C domain-containing protein [Bacteroides sp. GD17]|jgi:hypothetical protein|uniref:phosphatidylinositol-specific phospholipase C domain-containing protein n=1 Tax=Bacteroides sp. GD17 TaxID=3139826 RepID=UPI0025D39DC8|nr:phosphatidylinositol-specific phospholipase C domain-containing protein [uncultured Bacteroides sp.]
MKENLLSEYTLFEGAGEEWSDVCAYQAFNEEDPYRFPTQINIDYVQFIDRIQMVYADKELPMHGGGARKKMEIKFDRDEYIQTVICEYCKFGRSPYMICTLWFKTNKKEAGFRSFYQPDDRVKVEYTFPEGYALACIAGRTDHYNTNADPCVAGLKLFGSPIKKGRKILEDDTEKQHPEAHTLSDIDREELECSPVKTLDFKLESKEEYLDCFYWQKRTCLITYIKKSEKSFEFMLSGGKDDKVSRSKVFTYKCSKSIPTAPLSKVFVCSGALFWLLFFPGTTHSCLLMWENDTFKLQKNDTIPNLSLTFNKTAIQCTDKIRAIEIINYNNIVYLLALADILPPGLDRIQYRWHILLFDKANRAFIDHNNGRFYHRFDSAIFYNAGYRNFVHFIELADASKPMGLYFNHQCYIYDLEEKNQKLAFDFDIKTPSYMVLDPAKHKELRKIQYNDYTYLLEVKKADCQLYEYDTKKKHFVKKNVFADIFANLAYKQIQVCVDDNILCQFIGKSDVQFECKVFKLYDMTSDFFNQEDWMGDLYSKIKDQKLCDIKMPSTHNSGSFKYEIARRISCQSLSIKEQLEIGVRCFDIRLIVKGNSVYMHHNGFYFAEQSLSKAVDEISRFMTEHPKEFIILNLRKGKFAGGYSSDQLKKIRDLLLTLKDKVCINTLSASTTFGELDEKRRIMLNIISDELLGLADDSKYKRYFCRLKMDGTYSPDIYSTKDSTSTKQMQEMRKHLHKHLDNMPERVGKADSFFSLDIYAINISPNLYYSIRKEADLVKGIVKEEMASFDPVKRNEMLTGMNLITLDFITSLEARHIIKLNIYNQPMVICYILE